MDQLEKLFSDLRAETLPQVRPPGAQAARRTVRRRRGATSVAAALAVLAVVAGLTASLRTSREDVPPANPPVPGDTWLAWAGEAAKAVDLDLDAPVMGGALKEGLTGINAAVGGLYQAKVACVGDGSVTVTFVAAAGGYPSETTRLVVACGRTARTAATWFSVPGQEGKVLASYVAGTSGRTAVAFRLNLAQVDRYRLQDLANAAFKSPIPRNLLSGWSQFLEKETGSGHDVVGPGRYRVSGACAGIGIGKVLLTVSAVPDRGRATPVAHTTLSCGMTPKVTSVTFTIPETPALALHTALNPSQPARGQIATSVRIERV
jgi:hypothetical protein